MNKTVLIVDDEPRIRNLISEFLVRANYHVLEAGDGEQALKKIFSKKLKVDLVILDIMLPKYDGWFVLEKVRECFKTPIILLTAKSEESDQLRGFKMGADDYVCKPFSPSVLIARIDKILKEEDGHEDDIIMDKIVISDYAREVTVEGKPLEMTPKEYELLKYLITNKGMALSRERILNAVWNYDYLGDLRTVDTHIKQLRAKLKEAGEKIVTVRNIGYKMID